MKKSQSLEYSSLNQEYDNANIDNKVNAQRSSSSCSEDDSSISLQGQNAGPGSSVKDSKALNLSGKTRASRGLATAPLQKRGERISERMKILQNVVPNCTKVTN